MLAPIPASSSAETEPTLPNPWMATVAPLMSKPTCFADSRDDHHAAPRGFAPAERSAHLDRLAGHHRGRRCGRRACCVGVHDPRHDLLVGVDVGRGHVLLGADRVDDFGDVAARERLELALRHLRRIADDAALAAAERNVRDGALPGHPRRERRHFVERHAGVVADAAFGRAERDVVLHAVAGEDFDLAVVHLDRTGDDDLALGMGEDFPDAGLEVENARRAVELLSMAPKITRLRMARFNIPGRRSRRKVRSGSAPSL